MSGLMDYTITVNEKGECQFPGIDFSNKSPMLLVARNGDTLVVKHPGGTCWAGIAMPRTYVAAKLMIFRIIGKDKFKRTRVELLVEIPLKTTPLTGITI